MLNDEERLIDEIREGEEEAVEEANTEEQKTEVEASDEDATKEQEAEGKDEKAVELPELTDEQIAALREDPRFKPETPQTDIDSLLKSVIDEHEHKKESEREEAERKAGLEEALKAYQEGNAEPLADLAAKSVEDAQKRQALDAEVEAALEERLVKVVQANYMDELKAMSSEEVQALDKMPREQALGVLADKKAERIRAELAGQAKKQDEADATAEAGKAARKDAVGVLPGGVADKEGASGDSIGALMREGLGDALEYESD